MIKLDYGGHGSRPFNLGGIFVLVALAVFFFAAHCMPQPSAEHPNPLDWMFLPLLSVGAFTMVVGVGLMVIGGVLALSGRLGLLVKERTHDSLNDV